MGILERSSVSVYLEDATKFLTANELTKFSKLYNKRKKSILVARMLWALGFMVGLHRIYTGNYGTALGLTAITVFTCGIGAVAGIYDIKNISRLVDKSNKKIILDAVKEVKQKNGEWKQ